jgi:hypothetical protein
MIELDSANRESREGWEETFREMARRRDDVLDPEWLGATLTSFDDEEWEWS